MNQPISMKGNDAFRIKYRLPTRNTDVSIGYTGPMDKVTMTLFQYDKTRLKTLRIDMTAEYARIMARQLNHYADLCEKEQQKKLDAEKSQA